MTDKPNYAHLEIDSESGMPFIVEVGTLRKLFKHPLCRFCESAHYSYSPAPKDHCGCLDHYPSNSNVHPDDQDGLGLFRP